MLSNTHFYHRITRKMVVTFGTIFNNIRLVRYNQTGTTEIERINVPLTYMPKEKFYQRITQDPELTKETEITLPRMVFELNSITYDPLRKTTMFNQQFGRDASNADAVKGIRSAPYNFDFTLSLYVRNTEDGTQIIEQILPYFSPDYTVSIALTSLTDVKTDIPIILNSIQYSAPSSQGSADDLRVLNWDLTFTAKGMLYGPISSREIIRTAYANTFYFNTDTVGTKYMTLSSGSGDYKVGELVFEGTELDKANGSGFVESWDSVSNTLVLVDTSGIINTGKYLRGAISGASWNISSYSVGNYKMSSIRVRPDPLTANANDDFGFTTTITEY